MLLIKAEDQNNCPPFHGVKIPYFIEFETPLILGAPSYHVPLVTENILLVKLLYCL